MLLLVQYVVLFLVSDLWPMSSSSSSSNTVENPDETSRRVRSGPKERTQAAEASEEKTNIEPIQSQGKPLTTKSIRYTVIMSCIGLVAL